MQNLSNHHKPNGNAGDLKLQKKGVSLYTTDKSRETSETTEKGRESNSTDKIRIAPSKSDSNR